MDADEINEMLGLRPKFDIPAAARRAWKMGILSETEGGLPVFHCANQPDSLVRARLVGTQGAHRIALGPYPCSPRARQSARCPAGARSGRDSPHFARSPSTAWARSAPPRTFVQDIDGPGYDPALAESALRPILPRAISWACVRLRDCGYLRDDAEWACCDRSAPPISAKRAAPTAGCSAHSAPARQRNRRSPGAALCRGGRRGNRAVNIEWDEVDELTPWRYSLARAVGEDIPDQLATDHSGSDYEISDVLIPATPLLRRVEVSDTAAARGVLSSAAMVDLYSQLWASDRYDAADKGMAKQLREAYVANSAAQRLAAMRSLWGEQPAYGRLVLTAYAAARLPVTEEMAGDAGPLIASMLTAGLDRNALRWGKRPCPRVARRGRCWLLRSLMRATAWLAGAVDDFIDDDVSADKRKSALPGCRAGGPGASRR